MLENLSFLENKKNLLAFSAGGDSTALLFLLLEKNISFDIAIVNYGVRKEAKEEVAYAQELAQKYGFKCYIHTASPIQANFEAKAREIRYSFFEDLIQTQKQMHTSHQTSLVSHLGDQL